MEETAHGRDRAGQGQSAGPGTGDRAAAGAGGRGEEDTYPQVRALLEDPERGPVYIDGLCSISNIVRIKLVKAIARKDIFLQEAIHEKLVRIAAALEGESPSAVEVVLAEQIAINWLLLWRYQHAAVEVHMMTIPQAEFQQRLITQAQNRLNSSLVALARVRRLALPVLVGQVNIVAGHQQVVNEAESKAD